MKAIETTKDFEQIIASSASKPIFLFKHSSRCGVSSAAWQEFSDFMENTDIKEAFDFARVLVVEHRPVSLHIAAETTIPHQSPQVLLIKDGAAIWNTSHWAIKKGKLEEIATTHSNVS